MPFYSDTHTHVLSVCSSDTNKKRHTRAIIKTDEYLGIYYWKCSEGIQAPNVHYYIIIKISSWALCALCTYAYAYAVCIEVLRKGFLHNVNICSVLWCFRVLTSKTAERSYFLYSVIALPITNAKALKCTLLCPYTFHANSLGCIYVAVSLYFVYLYVSILCACPFHVNRLGLYIFTGSYTYLAKSHIYRNIYTSEQYLYKLVSMYTSQKFILTVACIAKTCRLYHFTL